MKNFSLFQKSFFLLLAISLFTFTACEDDPTGPGTGSTLPATVRLIDNGTGSITTDATVPGNQPFVFSVTASEGDNPMSTLTIFDSNGELADDRVNYVDGVAGSNPALLIDANSQSIAWDIEIAPHATGTETYTVTIADAGGESASVSVDITIAANPPTFTYQGTTDRTADAGTIIGFNLTAVLGDADLSTLTVLEDGVNVEAGRLSFNDVDFDLNPYSLPLDVYQGFDMKTLAITAVADANVTKAYTVILTDEVGNEETVNFNIITNAIGTAIDMTLEGILFNQAGPSGTGGLNLLDGSSTGSSSTTAHLRDEGVDLSQTPADNWIQRFRGVNGAEVRVVNTDVLPEGFTFANVQFKEEITGAFDNGTPLTITNDDGQLTTNNVQVGDLYVVKNSTNTFLIEITAVNVFGLDDDGYADNGDNYVMDIKY